MSTQVILKSALLSMAHSPRQVICPALSAQTQVLWFHSTEWETDGFYTNRFLQTRMLLIMQKHYGN